MRLDDVIVGLRKIGLCACHVECFGTEEGIGHYSHPYPGDQYGWFKTKNGMLIMVVFYKPITEDKKRIAEDWIEKWEIHV